MGGKRSLPQPASVASSSTTVAPEIPSEMGSLSQVVDQSLKASVKIINYTELAQLRMFYERVTGCAAPDEAQPTPDQLAGLRAVLLSGRVPYVDFAVWSNLGPRLAKFWRTEASVFIGGELVSKSLDGPATHAGWEESRQIFSVAMVSLGAASPGALQAYAAGIRTLLKLFPGRWGTIPAADLVVRSERLGEVAGRL